MTEDWEIPTNWKICKLFLPDGNGTRLMIAVCGNKIRIRSLEYINIEGELANWTEDVIAPLYYLQQEMIPTKPKTFIEKITSMFF